VRQDTLNPLRLGFDALSDCTVVATGSAICGTPCGCHHQPDRESDQRERLAVKIAYDALIFIN